MGGRSLLPHPALFLLLPPPPPPPDQLSTHENDSVSKQKLLLSLSVPEFTESTVNSGTVQGYNMQWDKSF